MTTPRRGAAALAAAVTLTLLLAACGEITASESATAPTAAAEVSEVHNDADIVFAQGMIPHHRQAVMMSALAGGRTENPDVLELTEEISAAQEPEIRTMTAFLEAWGADAPMGGSSEMPMGDMGDMEGMDHGDMDMDDMAQMEGMEGMSGMMTPQQMAELEAAEGAEFDRLFLEMMIEHHEGAVEMADTQLDEGENPDARALAEEIIEAQESEITRMQDLLDAS
jgi:uncharacterized protein (DUF305 family)